MTFWTFIRRSLRFHGRAHLGVVLGAAIGSAVLLGALLVGDSVRQSLREQSLAGAGPFYYALAPADRLFSEGLAKNLRTQLPQPPASAAPAGLLEPISVGFGRQTAASARQPYRDKFLVTSALALPATVSSRNGSARANQARVLGIDQDFLSALSRLGTNEAVLNAALASQLGVGPGAEILLRVQKPSALSREVSLMQRDHASSTLRLTVAGILPPEQGGNFSLQRSQSPPLNVFVRHELLAQAAGVAGQANLLLVGSLGSQDRDAVERVPTGLVSALRAAWQLPDAALHLQQLPAAGAVELRTPRIFLEPAAVQAAQAASPSGSAQPLLTYLANSLSAGTNKTPYSLVTAAGTPYTPADLRDDEIMLNQWLADDLQAQPGQTIELTYFLPESGTRLTEATNRFRVRGIVPMTLPWADRTLMPEFPGIEQAESTRDWDLGFPLVHKIRPQDEEYWKTHRGTPKAFITLAAGQKLWANRFGEATAVRWSAASLPEPARAALPSKLLSTLKPEALGLRFEPIRAQALQAAAQSQDFGQLFLGFSCFLVLAALLLMALLFQFGLEQRASEIGTLLALGFTPRQVRRLLLVEGTTLAAIGGLLGALAGSSYAQAMLWGLTTVWRRAIGTSALQFHASLLSFIVGCGASIVVAGLTIWLTLRHQARQPASELLAGTVRSPMPGARSRGIWIALGAGLAAAGLLTWALATGQTTNAGAFFGAGALLLVTGLALAAAWLGAVGHQAISTRLTLGGLGLRACARRRKRSLAAIALLSCGSFLIAAIGVFRLDANQNAGRHSAGTGGFALIGQSTLPVVQDLNEQSGREAFGLNPGDLAGVRIVPFRVREGDDASCLNLNRAQKPRLLGVQPEALQGRFTFTQVAPGLDRAKGWELLRGRGERGEDGGWRMEDGKGQSAPPDEIPVIGDANSIQWALGKKVGDTLDYTDEQGRTFKLRLVGAVANSILQGNLVIDAARFRQRFPSQSGYRMFLLDVPANAVSQISANLTRALQDVGLELTPAARRLDAFNAVQNTYLNTFQVLGGLGLLLGSAGLGVVVLRNVLERRGELGLLLAVGFRPRALQALLLIEHSALLGLGLGIGLLAAAVAVLPALLSPAMELPYASLGLTLGGVLLNGWLWTFLATRYALRGDLLQALRNE
ncbi:MAG TPA: FtsX-like permease family protein [Bacillota bacterium]|nr:FtsX-like permease family protein [Bacillota bacterium]